MSIYRVKEEAPAYADNMRDLNTRMADVGTLETSLKGITKILGNMNKQRQDDLAGINANFKSIDKALTKRPTASSKLPAVTTIAKNTAAGAMYYGPRTVLFSVVTVVSVAVAAIFYGNQFENQELVNAAWLAVYASAGALVPSSVLTWFTRRK